MIFSIIFFWVYIPKINKIMITKWISMIKKQSQSFGDFMCTMKFKEIYSKFECISDKPTNFLLYKVYLQRYFKKNLSSCYICTFQHFNLVLTKRLIRIHKIYVQIRVCQKIRLYYGKTEMSLTGVLCKLLIMFFVYSFSYIV